MSEERESLPLHEELFADLDKLDWNRWRALPLTRAFHSFISDQVEAFEQGALQLLRGGALDSTSPNPAINPHYIRGQIEALEALRDLNLATIASFYSQRREDRADLEQPDRTDFPLEPDSGSDAD